MSLSIPPLLALPVRVSPPGASFMADSRQLNWRISGPQALLPGSVLALAAAFMLPLTKSPDAGEEGGLAAVSTSLLEVTQSITANVCLTGVAGEGMDIG